MSEILNRLTTALSRIYRIDRELGQGGMATVYLAHDIKHDRQVAVKVLKPELGAVLGAGRFLSEIKVTANLQHPNLLPLFDSGEADGLLYYVMPYIEGETLRTRLQREQQLPVDEAVRLVTLMAGALDFAHARGVVHRDLKPENVLLQAGQPIIADFGIALAVSQAGGERVTQTGLSLGTPHYMSPEQAAGDRAVDARSDQYALGALTYEMLMGEPPHTGPTAQMIIARVMTETPRSIRAARPAVSASVDAAVQRALAKMPADRFASCTAFAHALKVADSESAAKSSSRFRTKTIVAAVAGIATIASVVAFLLLRDRGGSELPSLGRTTQVTRDPGLELDPALSRDGSMIAYAQGPATHMQIYVQQVSGGKRIALTSDTAEHFRSPAWSPDGTQIAFHGTTGVYVVASLGGEPRLVVRRDTVYAEKIDWLNEMPFNGVGWSPDGRRLVYVEKDSIRVVASTGGSPLALSTPMQSSSPSWSPDGKFIAVTAGNPLFVYGTGYLGNAGTSAIWIVPVDGAPAVQVTSKEHLNISPKWSADGTSLYWISDRDGTRDVFRARFNARTVALSDARRLTTGIEAMTISLAADGSSVAYSNFRAYSNIWAMDVPGTTPMSVKSAQALTTGFQIIEMLDVSDDGKTLVFDSDRSGNADIYRMATSGGDAVRLTADSAGDFGPVFSPDGRHVAFHSLRSGSRDIYTMNVDGIDVVRRTSWPTQELDAQWSPDGSTVGFEVFGDTVGPATIFRSMRLEDGELSVRTLGANGDFLAWSSTNVMSYHAADGIRTLATATDIGRQLVDNNKDGGVATLGIWSPDGATLYYLSRRPTGWEVRAVAGNGRASRTLVHLDDPMRQPTRYGFATDGRRFYLTLGTTEGDISVMTLEKR